MDQPCLRDTFSSPRTLKSDAASSSTMTVIAKDTDVERTGNSFDLFGRKFDSLLWPGFGNLQIDNLISKDGPGMSKNFNLRTKDSIHLCTCNEDVAVAYCTDCADHLCRMCTSAHSRVRLTSSHNIKKLTEEKTPKLENHHEISILDNTVDLKKFEDERGVSTALVSGDESLKKEKSVPKISMEDLIGKLNREGGSADIVTPSKDVMMKVFTQAIHTAKSECEEMLTTSQTYLMSMQQMRTSVDQMRHLIQLKLGESIKQIEDASTDFISVIEAEKEKALVNVKKIVETKNAILDRQLDELSHENSVISRLSRDLITSTKCVQTSDVEKFSVDQSETSVLLLRDRASSLISNVNQDCFSSLYENDVWSVDTMSREEFISRYRLPHLDSSAVTSKTTPGNAISIDQPCFESQNTVVVGIHQPPPPAISALFSLRGSPHAPNCLGVGDGLLKAIVGKEARFTIHLFDQLGERLTTGLSDSNQISILISSSHVSTSKFESSDTSSKFPTPPPSSESVKYCLYDCNNGSYQVVYLPISPSPHHVVVKVRGVGIRNAPFTVNVLSVRNYADSTDLNTPKLKFGGEGSANGQLFRPWGICCSYDGKLVYVANRSNNRVEVFDASTGKFIFNFGKSGKLNGQFDRPAGVCCDHKSRIVITDKDNHRVQIFTLTGAFLQKFGEKGFGAGQFNYPWDVAVSSIDNILISDTRNHRIQMFDQTGRFVAKYGFEGPLSKHFDSPRGVAFTLDDRPVVTDFNNHRLLIIKKDFESAQFLGQEGSDGGMFLRPNGVTVDFEGNFLVSDSRNHRVQVFSPSGVLIRIFGSGPGIMPGQFDRPSGICVSPDGSNIYVVDFGNDRVQVF